MEVGSVGEEGGWRRRWLEELRVVGGIGDGELDGERERGGRGEYLAVVLSLGDGGRRRHRWE